MRVYIIVPLFPDYLKKKKSGPQNGWALVSESAYYCHAPPDYLKKKSGPQNGWALVSESAYYCHAPPDYLKKKSGPQNGWALVSESVYYCPALPGLPEEEEERTPERLGPGQ